MALPRPRLRSSMSRTVLCGSTTSPRWCSLKASSTAARAVEMSTPVSRTSFWLRYRKLMPFAFSLTSTSLCLAGLHLPDDALQLRFGGGGQRVRFVLGQDFFHALARLVGHVFPAALQPLLPGLAV